MENIWEHSPPQYTAKAIESQARLPLVQISETIAIGELGRSSDRMKMDLALVLPLLSTISELGYPLSLLFQPSQEEEARVDSQRTLGQAIIQSIQQITRF